MLTDIQLQVKRYEQIQTGLTGCSLLTRPSAIKGKVSIGMEMPLSSQTVRPRPWKGCTGGKACMKTCDSISDMAQNVRKTNQTAIRNQVICVSHCGSSDRRWESISADLITQLLMTTSGNTTIVVFVDRLGKMVHFAAGPTAFSA